MKISHNPAHVIPTLPLSIGLTAEEIADALSFQSFYEDIRFTHERDENVTSVIADEGRDFVFQVRHPRTGHTCVLIGWIDEPDDAPDDVHHVVELQIDGKYFYLYLKSKSSCDADVLAARNLAHDRYIKACAMIGVKVGYHLVENPPEIF